MVLLRISNWMILCGTKLDLLCHHCTVNKRKLIKLSSLFTIFYFSKMIHPEMTEGNTEDLMPDVSAAFIFVFPNLKDVTLYFTFSWLIALIYFTKVKLINTRLVKINQVLKITLKEVSSSAFLLQSPRSPSLNVNYTYVFYNVQPYKDSSRKEKISDEHVLHSKVKCEFFFSYFLLKYAVYPPFSCDIKLWH